MLIYEFFDHPREGMGFLGEKNVESESGPVEAYGYRYNNRDQRIVWRKIFPSGEAAYAWADRNNATVLGTRSTEQR